MWNEEEKMTVVEILARESFDYMVVNLVLNGVRTNMAKALAPCLVDIVS